MILTKIQTVRLGTITLLLGGLLGCSLLDNSTTDIADIQQNRNAYSTIYLKGVVEKSAPFLGSGAYELKDASGSIWVVRDRALPKQGDQITIKGKVEYQSIPIAGQELGEVYIKELE